MVDKQIEYEWRKLVLLLMHDGVKFVEYNEGEQDILYNMVSRFKISVPEFNTMEDNYVPEGFLQEVKMMLLDFFCKICECEDDEDRSLVQEMIKVYGKIRKGETWTQSDGDELLAEILSKIKKVKQNGNVFVEVLRS